MELDFFHYFEVPPHPSLKDIVTHYRVTGAKQFKSFVLPDYSSIFQGLIFNLLPLNDLFLEKNERIGMNYKVYFVGQAISPSVLLSTSQQLNIVAVNFTPTGVYQLTGSDMDVFTDRIIDADQVFGQEINELYDRVVEFSDGFQAVHVIDNFLCLKAREQKRKVKSCIETSLSVFENDAANVSVKMLQNVTQMSARTLERSFKSELGMSPKMYQRLLRFNQTKIYIDQLGIVKDWWELVVKFGYYDRSHFISEFRFFTGQTPKQYLENRFVVMNSF